MGVRSVRRLRLRETQQQCHGGDLVQTLAVLVQTVVVRGQTVAVRGQTVVVHGQTVVVRGQTVVVHGQTVVVHGQMAGQQDPVVAVLAAEAEGHAMELDDHVGRP